MGNLPNAQAPSTSKVFFFSFPYFCIGVFNHTSKYCISKQPNEISSSDSFSSPGAAPGFLFRGGGIIQLPGREVLRRKFRSPCKDQTHLRRPQLGPAALSQTFFWRLKNIPLCLKPGVTDNPQAMVSLFYKWSFTEHRHCPFLHNYCPWYFLVTGGSWRVETEIYSQGYYEN